MTYIDFEDFQNNKFLCNAWVATAVVGSAVIGAGTSLYTSSKAAEAQQQAALAAGQSQVAAARAGAAAYEQMAREALGYIKPYSDLGNFAGKELKGRLNDLTSTNYNLPTAPDGNFTQEDLEATPGYKFTREQGLKAVQNSAAARGLGVSGAALKGAATFATGLADQTYNTRFGQQVTAYEKALQGVEEQRAIKQDAYSRLKGLVDTGATAAGNAANVVSGIGKSQQQAAQNVGEAQAGAAINSANAEAAAYNVQGKAINQAANTIGGYAASPYGGAALTKAAGSIGDWLKYNSTYG